MTVLTVMSAVLVFVSGHKTLDDDDDDDERQHALTDALKTAKGMNR